MRRSYSISFLLAVGTSVVLAVLLAACSPNKNNAATRKYQEFITRYNIYYNGDTHFKETLAEMERKYEDDYSRILFMHPIEAKGKESVPQPAGDFTRSIEKAQKAIQVRSIKKKPKKQSGKSRDPKYQEWMKREEYNPFLHNAWMMMGRSQYYNGDFLGAASTFFYTSRHFSWLPETVTEAKLMQALSYISLGWQYEGEVIITRIKPEELTNNTLRRLYNYTYANFYIHAEDFSAAVPFLQAAIKGSKGHQKIRLNFLLGQVYQRLGMNAEAYKAFSDAGSSPSAAYRTKFNARIKQSEVFEGDNIETEIKKLKRMTRYDRNKEYLDQIYYAIGNLYLSRSDTAKAIENYELANEKSTRNGIDKAMNQLRLGGLYFERGNYEKAQPNYSEAIAQLPKTFPDYANLKRRSDVLDELAVYSQNVNLQDSLLRLAAMPEEQRNAAIDKLIEEYKEQEKLAAEQAAREEYEANKAATNQLQANTQSFNINSDNSWYFYNTTTKNAGKAEFQKKWGSRKLEDDWRRRNKSSFNTSDFDNTEEETEEQASEEESSGEEEMTDEQKEALERANDPHYPEYYLAQLPMTDEEKQTSHEIIQEGLYNMGIILKDKLEDFDAAYVQFDRLNTDYPDNTYRLDTYYNLYLMCVRADKPGEAEQFRQLILRDFADSKYGVAMLDPNYLDKLRGMEQMQEDLYAKTYEAYLNNNNAAVHGAYEKMNSEYPLSEIMHKFMFLHALAYVTEHNSEAFNATLRDLLDRYPNTDVTPYASEWLKGMAQGRKLQSSSTNMRGMIWDLRLSNDSAFVASDSLAQFELSPDVRQTLVFTFATDKVATNELLFAIARHNFRSFVVKDFDLEQMNFGRLGMIVVRGFENMEELNHYRGVMGSSPEFKLPAGVRPVVISEANLKLMLDEGRSFEEYFRYLEEQNYVDAQADLIPIEEIETLEEAEQAAEEVAEEATENVTNEIAQPAPQEPATEQPKPSPQKPATEQPKSAPQKPAAEQPKPSPMPLLPGSEGDDPLFDD